MNSAYLFPGQGSFLPHALKNLAGASKEASAVLDALDSGASHFYKERPAKRILDGSLEISANVSVSDFEAIQLAIFATPLAVFRILQGNGAPPPELLIGHSFGEIPALVAAGAFTVEEGAAIVCARNTALRKAGIAGGMLALATDTGTAGALVAFLDDPFLTVAVHNSPRQTVLSGSEEAIAKAAAVARTAQLTSARLPSPYPFHHPALTTASREFRRSIDSIRPRALTIPVYSPILRKFYSAEDDLLTCLAEHLVRPVQFTEAIRDLHARGTDRFVECGAQSTLTSLVKRTVPDVTTIICLDNRTATSDFLQRAVDTLAGQPISSESTQVPADPSPPPLHTQQKEQFTAMNTSSPDRDEVLAALKALYAQALEYPEEVFSPDVELEADLGVDSLKQTELLARVADEYGLPETLDGFRVTDHGTLAQIADLVIANTAPTATPAGECAEPETERAHTLHTGGMESTAARQGSGQTATPADRDEVLAALKALYAQALEYPEEVFSPDVELEADLGVDSLKQTELLARVADEYGLPETLDGFRVTDHGTLAQIADLVISSRSSAAGSEKACAALPVGLSVTHKE